MKFHSMSGSHFYNLFYNGIQIFLDMLLCEIIPYILTFGISYN